MIEVAAPVSIVPKPLVTVTIAGKVVVAEFADSVREKGTLVDNEAFEGGLMTLLIIVNLE